MSIFNREAIRAIAVAMLCLAGQAAQAQVAPVQYWLPGGPFGFGGSAGGATTYGNFPGFDAPARDGDWRDNFRTGLFVSGQAGSAGLNRLGLGMGQAGAASAFGALAWQSTLTGYNFKGAGNLPVSVYAGFDSLNYRPGLGSPLAPFSTDASIAAGYRARAGIAFQPSANVTVSLEAGFTQQGTGDGDINSALLPASPFYGVRR
jgi:hypothetical protein